FNLLSRRLTGHGLQNTGYAIAILIHNQWQRVIVHRKAFGYGTPRQPLDGWAYPQQSGILAIPAFPIVGEAGHSTHPAAFRNNTLTTACPTNLGLATRQHLLLAQLCIPRWPDA